MSEGGAAILARLRSEGISVAIDGGRLRLKGRRAAMTPEVLSLVRDSADTVRAELERQSMPASIRRRRELHWSDDRFATQCLRVLGTVGLRSHDDDARVLARMPRVPQSNEE